jgi:dinuclear metal center YbgI/SA1388 family protein
MTCCVSDIIQAIEKLAPAELAAAWDNSGLQVGDGAWSVQLIWVALDPLPEVVSRACEANVDMLVTHHPLIFKPFRRLDMATPDGATIAWAVQHQLAIFSAHTNLDAVKGGTNDMLASKIGLKDVTSLDFSSDEGVHNLGRIGRLPKETTLMSLALQLKQTLGIDSLKIAGRSNLIIRNAFICSGSGSSLLPEFIRSGADVFISGDLKYHDARAIEAAGKGLVDIGHFASERVMIEVLSTQLSRLLKGSGKAIAVEPYLFEKDPFVMI